MSAGAKLLCLPEAFSYVGARDGDSVKIAEPLDGPIMQRYCSLARWETLTLLSQFTKLIFVHFSGWNHFDNSLVFILEMRLQVSITSSFFPFFYHSWVGRNGLLKDLFIPVTDLWSVMHHHRESSIWLSLGGFQEKGSDDEHLHNTHVVIDDIGNIRSTYRKIHL